MNVLSSRFRHSGPPTRTAPPVAKDAPSELQEAAPKEKSGVSWGLVALGVGAAAGAVVGMANMAGAAPAAVGIEAPEVVVLSESIQRIDLDRRTEEVCEPGDDGVELCEEEDVAYHPVGVHAGSGVVRDLNGNLFVAPQLVTPEAPGVATVNPNRVEVKGPFGSRGYLKRQSDGDYDVSGTLFGRHSIEIDGRQAEIREKGVFGSSWRAEISHKDGHTLINERFEQDHVLTTNDSGARLETRGLFGNYVAGVDHVEGSWTVDYPGWLSDNTTLHYDSNKVVVKQDGWSVRKLERDDDQVKVKDAAIFPTTLSTTTKDAKGWTDKAGGLWGTSYRYKVDGGDSHP